MTKSISKILVAVLTLCLICTCAAVSLAFSSDALKAEAAAYSADSVSYNVEEDPNGGYGILAVAGGTFATVQDAVDDIVARDGTDNIICFGALPSNADESTGISLVNETVSLATESFTLSGTLLARGTASTDYAISVTTDGDVSIAALIFDDRAGTPLFVGAGATVTIENGAIVSNIADGTEVLFTSVSAAKNEGTLNVKGKLTTLLPGDTVCNSDSAVLYVGGTDADNKGLILSSKGVAVNGGNVTVSDFGEVSASGSIAINNPVSLLVEGDGENGGYVSGTTAVAITDGSLTVTGGSLISAGGQYVVSVIGSSDIEISGGRLYTLGGSIFFFDDTAAFSSLILKNSPVFEYAAIADFAVIENSVVALGAADYLPASPDAVLAIKIIEPVVGSAAVVGATDTELFVFDGDYEFAVQGTDLIVAESKGYEYAVLSKGSRFVAKAYYKSGTEYVSAEYATAKEAIARIDADRFFDGAYADCFITFGSEELLDCLYENEITFNHGQYTVSGGMSGEDSQSGDAFVKIADGVTVILEGKFVSTVNKAVEIEGALAKLIVKGAAEIVSTGATAIENEAGGAIVFAGNPVIEGREIDVKTTTFIDGKDWTAENYSSSNKLTIVRQVNLTNGLTVIKDFTALEKIKLLEPVDTVIGINGNDIAIRFKQNNYIITQDDSYYYVIDRQMIAGESFDFVLTKTLTADAAVIAIDADRRSGDSYVDGRIDFGDGDVIDALEYVSFTKGAYAVTGKLTSHANGYALYITCDEFVLNGFTLTQEGTGAALFVKENSVATVDGATIANTDAGSYIAINEGTLNVVDSSVTNNSSAIAFENRNLGTLNVTDSTVNTVDSLSDSGDVSIVNSEVIASGNAAIKAIKTLYVENSTIEGKGAVVSSVGFTAKDSVLTSTDGYVLVLTHGADVILEECTLNAVDFAIDFTAADASTVTLKGATVFAFSGTENAVVYSTNKDSYLVSDGYTEATGTRFNLVYTESAVQYDKDAADGYQKQILVENLNEEGKFYLKTVGEDGNEVDPILYYAGLEFGGDDLIVKRIKDVVYAVLFDEATKYSVEGTYRDGSTYILHEGGTDEGVTPVAFAEVQGAMDAIDASVQNHIDFMLALNGDALETYCKVTFVEVPFAAYTATFKQGEYDVFGQITEYTGTEYALIVNEGVDVEFSEFTSAGGVSNNGTLNIVDGSAFTAEKAVKNNGTLTANEAAFNGTVINGGSFTAENTDITGDVTNNADAELYLTAGEVTGAVTNSGIIETDGSTVNGAVLNNVGAALTATDGTITAEGTAVTNDGTATLTDTGINGNIANNGVLTLDGAAVTGKNIAITNGDAATLKLTGNVKIESDDADDATVDADVKSNAAIDLDGYTGAGISLLREENVVSGQLVILNYVDASKITLAENGIANDTLVRDGANLDGDNLIYRMRKFDYVVRFVASKYYVYDTEVVEDTPIYTLFSVDSTMLAQAVTVIDSDRENGDAYVDCKVKFDGIASAAPIALNNGNYDVSGSLTFTDSSPAITVGAGATVTATGTAETSNGTLFENNGTVTLTSATLTGAVINNNTLTLNGGMLDGNLTNNGTVTAAAILMTGTLINAADKTFDLNEEEGDISTIRGAVTNDGSFTVKASECSITGDVTGTGSFIATEGKCTVDGAVTYDGIFTVIDAEITGDVISGGTFTATDSTIGGTFTNKATFTATLTGGTVTGLVINNGTMYNTAATYGDGINNAVGATLSFTENAVATEVTGDFINDGTVNVDSELSVDGDLTNNGDIIVTGVKLTVTGKVFNGGEFTANTAVLDVDGILTNDDVFEATSTELTAGGIINNKTLTLNEATVNASLTGAAGAVVTATDGSITAEGIAVTNGGTATFTGTVINGNIVNDGILTLNGTAVTGKNIAITNGDSATLKLTGNVTIVSDDADVKSNAAIDLDGYTGSGISLLREENVVGGQLVILNYVDKGKIELVANGIDGEVLLRDGENLDGDNLIYRFTRFDYVVRFVAENAETSLYLYDKDGVEILIGMYAAMSDVIDAIDTERNASGTYADCNINFAPTTDGGITPISSDSITFAYGKYNVTGYLTFNIEECAIDVAADAVLNTNEFNLVLSSGDAVALDVAGTLNLLNSEISANGTGSIALCVDAGAIAVIEGTIIHGADAVISEGTLTLKGEVTLEGGIELVGGSYITATELAMFDTPVAIVFDGVTAGEGEKRLVVDGDADYLENFTLAKLVRDGKEFTQYHLELNADNDLIATATEYAINYFDIGGAEFTETDAFASVLPSTYTVENYKIFYTVSKGYALKGIFFEGLTEELDNDLLLGDKEGYKVEQEWKFYIDTVKYYTSGDGTEAAPYVISEAASLDAFIWGEKFDNDGIVYINVDGAFTLDGGKTVKTVLDGYVIDFMGNDLTVVGLYTADMSDEELGTNAFAYGVFPVFDNGAVKNLNIVETSDITVDGDSEQYAGLLIGYGFNATVAEVKLTAALSLAINGSNKNYVGGLIGHVEQGIIYNVINNQDVYVDAEFAGVTSIGGIVASISDTLILNAEYYGMVSGSENAAGIVAFASGANRVYNSFSQGASAFCEGVDTIDVINVYDVVEGFASAYGAYNAGDVSDMTDKEAVNAFNGNLEGIGTALNEGGYTGYAVKPWYTGKYTLLPEFLWSVVVTFDPAGGIIDGDDFAVLYIDDVVVFPDVSYDAYEFMYWEKDGTEYYVEPMTDADADFALVAVWRIVYNPADGSGFFVSYGDGLYTVRYGTSYEDYVFTADVTNIYEAIEEALRGNVYPAADITFCDVVLDTDAAQIVFDDEYYGMFNEITLMGSIAAGFENEQPVLTVSKNVIMNGLIVTAYEGKTAVLSTDALEVSGSAVINGVVIVSGGDVTISDSVVSGKITVEEGTLAVDAEVADIDNYGALTVNGGMVGTITDFGTVEINDGTVGAVTTGGELTVKGGTVVGLTYAKEGSAVYVYGGTLGAVDASAESTVYLYGGSIGAVDATADSVVYLYGGTSSDIESDGTVVVDGSTVDGDITANYAADLYSGSVSGNVIGTGIIRLATNFVSVFTVGGYIQAGDSLSYGYIGDTAPDANVTPVLLNKDEPDVGDVMVDCFEADPLYLGYFTQNKAGFDLRMNDNMIILGLVKPQVGDLDDVDVKYGENGSFVAPEATHDLSGVNYAYAWKLDGVLVGDGATYDVPARQPVGSYAVTLEVTAWKNDVSSSVTLSAAFNVSKKTVKVIAEDRTYTYGDDMDFSYTMTGLYDWDRTIDVLPTYNNTYVNVGIYDVVYAGASDANYDFAYEKGKLIIRKYAFDVSGITFENKTVLFDGKEHVLTVTGTLPAGLTVRYENNKGTKPSVYTSRAIFVTPSLQNYVGINDLTAVLTIKPVNVTASPIGTGLEVNINNTETGFEVSSVLVVKNIKQSSYNFSDALGNGQEIVASYNATYYVNSIVTAIDFPVKVTVKTPDSLASRKNVKLYVVEDGKVVEKAYDTAAGAFTYTATELGDFVFSADVEPIVEPVKPTPAPEDKGKGLDWWIYLVIFGGIAVFSLIVALIVTASRRRKEAMEIATRNANFSGSVSGEGENSYAYWKKYINDNLSEYRDVDDE